ncbi:MAG TPA: hypothetical protein VKA68_15205 [bacterium]|nr:hypothetical protein [bacterium]
MQVSVTGCTSARSAFRNRVWKRIPWFPLLITVCVLLLLCDSVESAQRDHSTTLVFPTKSHAPLRKATGTHLFLAIGRRTYVNNPQGTALAKLTVSDDPNTEKDDDELTVYGVNAGNNEIIYNTSLLNIEIYREPPDQPGSLLHPRGITANIQGDVYVADMGHGRVARLFNERGKQLVYRSAGTPPGDPVFTPFDCSLAEDGSVFIADSTGGKLWRWFPREHRWEIILDDLDTPLGLVAYDARDPWTRYKPSRLGIVAGNGSSVIIVDYNGNILAEYKPQEKMVGFRYIAVDYFGNYYVTDVRNSQIVKIDRHGELVDRIGHEGQGDYQFLRPQGISIWKRFGQVCVAESYAAQYYLIGTDILEPAIQVEDDMLNIAFTLTENSQVSIRIRPASSEREIGVLDEVKILQGRYHHRWRIPHGFPPGAYSIQITARPAYSSTKYFSVREDIAWNYHRTEDSKR